MNVEKYLWKFMAEGEAIPIDDSFRCLWIGDKHEGIGDPADDFKKNYSLCSAVIAGYRVRGYKIGHGGDCYDLWENHKKDRTLIDTLYPNVKAIEGEIELEGNHDQSLGFQQFIKLVHPKRTFIVTHGHLVDFWSGPIAKLFIRYIWRNLQMFGAKDPTSATIEKNPKKHEAVRNAIIEWANMSKITVIFGHTHAPEIGDHYANWGSWVGQGGYGIEQNGAELTLKRFT